MPYDFGAASSGDCGVNLSFSEGQLFQSMHDIDTSIDIDFSKLDHFIDTDKHIPQVLYEASMPDALSHASKPNDLQHASTPNELPHAHVSELLHTPLDCHHTTTCSPSSFMSYSLQIYLNSPPNPDLDHVILIPIVILILFQ